MRRPLYGWLAAEGISLLGTRISMLAIPLFVLETTGSATRTGFVAFAEMLPLVVTKVLSGPIIDKVGAVRIAVSCDVASLVAVGLVPLLHHSGLLTYHVLVALVAVAGALRGPGDAAKQALVPRLVAAAQVPTERATGLAGAVERTASMVGIALGGTLVAMVGGANALTIDAASFGLSALVLVWAVAGLSAPSSSHRPPEAAGDGGAAAGPASYASQLREGWAFLRGDRLLLALALMIALTNLLDAAAFSVLMPVWSVESGAGAATLGVLLAIWSGMSAIGALGAAAFGQRIPRYAFYVVAFLVTGLPRFLVMAFDAPVVAIGAVFVVGGLLSGLLNPIIGAVEYERIPEGLVGRVTSLITAVAWALMPLGGLLGGLLVDQAGLTVALVSVGVAYFAVTILPALDPVWREMDYRPERDREPAAA